MRASILSLSTALHPELVVSTLFSFFLWAVLLVLTKCRAGEQGPGRRQGTCTKVSTRLSSSLLS